MAELSDSVHGKSNAFVRLETNTPSGRLFPMLWRAIGLLGICFQIPRQSGRQPQGLVAIGDANFLGGDYIAGRDSLATAMHCPGAIGNPFIHFRLGQCQFEVGNHERAADELMRAYMGSGREIFDQHDLKYFQFLASRAKDMR